MKNYTVNLQLPKRQCKLDSVPLVFDIETDGLNPKTNKIFAYCVATLEGDVKIFRRDSDKNFIQNLEKFINDISIPKICHNLKFEYSFLKNIFPLNKKIIWHDTMVLSQLLQSNRKRHSLDFISSELFEYEIDTDNEIEKQFKLYKNYEKIPVELMNRYQKADGERTALLFNIFWGDIKKDSLLMEDYLIEIELIKATVAIEENGIKISIKEIDNLIAWLKNEMYKVQEETFKEIGEYANLNSDIQVKRILFNDRKFPCEIKTKKGNISVDKNVLMIFKEKYPNEKIFDLILKWRSYTHGIAIVKGYKKLADKNNLIHPNILPNQAGTGRQSCRKPNLQNVAKTTALKNLYPIPARRCFCSPSDCILLFADYAQIEMRLIIDSANDEAMLKMLDDGLDIHQEFMECIRGKDYVQKLKIENPKQFKIFRNADKNGHFALGYGASAYKIANTVGMSIEEFMKGYKLYKQRHGNIVKLLSIICTQVNKEGYIITPFGRKLYPEKPYAGLNYLIQGTAAGILKRGEVAIANNPILKKDFKGAEMILPIHDELVFKYPRYLLSVKKDFMNIVSQCMTQIEHIKVKLDIEWKKTFTTWEKAQ